MGSRPRWLAALFVGGLAFVRPAALAAQPEPTLTAIAAAGRATVDRLQKKPASWTAVFEMPGGNEAHVVVTSAPPMRRIAVSLRRGARLDPVLDIIERDGLWYVTHSSGAFKYRPYEAPVAVPALYVYLARSELRAIVDDAVPLGELVERQGPLATYRNPFPAAVRQNLQASLNSILQLEKQAPDKIDDQTKETKARLQELLESGTELKVNVENGVVEQLGSPGQRCWVRQLRWLDEVDPQAFEVANETWTDRSTSLIEDPRARSNVTMIGNAALWQPGHRGPDTELLLLDIETGQTRRLPYALGLASSGCFSKDRARVYIAGQVPDAGGMGIFEIDLATGEHRQLGGPELQVGITMFPSLSPDGRQLAVVHPDQAAGPLMSQVFLIDVESGDSRPIGKPLDTSTISWLPQGEGLVLVSREHQSLDEVATATICRLDLNGNLTVIRKGSAPVVLHADSRILFQDQDDDLWKTCDLDGNEVRLLRDGMKSFGFPTISPDGQRLIMMKFGGQQGPEPHVVDLATGTARALAVGPGLWAMPAWK